MKSQLVDPFIPAKPRPTNRVRPLAYHPPAGPLHRQHLRPAPSPPLPPVSSKSNPEPASKPVRKAKRSNKETISTIWLLVGASIGGLALFSVVAGEIALALYAIVAIWRRWPSQQTFMLALVMFGGIILTSLIQPFRYIADNLAIYAFLLLCIGAFCLAREVRRDTRRAA